VRDHHQDLFAVELLVCHSGFKSPRGIIARALLECPAMINLKSPREIERMKSSSRIVAEILLELREVVRDGITTADIDRLAHEMTLKRNARPAFKGYRGFPASICISINDEVVHGIPSPKRVVRSGDVVGLDFGVVFDGFFGDSAMTLPIGVIPAEVQQLLNVTERALYRAIEASVPGNYISDISAAVQGLADAHQYGVVRDFCGHGIGRSLHEDPHVFNYVQNGKGPKVKPGLVIAIEPMINMGTEKVKVLEDGWTVVTLDGKPSAHFEHTIAITPAGPEILTRI
jgi:methionyl aminopeptidase